jgi:hypothetical protein
MATGSMQRTKMNNYGHYKKTALVFALLIMLLSISATAQETTWNKENPDKVPPGRDDHMMAFDSFDGIVIMYGGDKGGGATWFWNGENWKDSGINSPANRREAVMVYNPKRNFTVMFGGFDYTLDSPITYVFEYEKWEGSIDGNGPEGRSDFAMAYADHMEMILLYGGEGMDGNVWGYDFGDWELIAEETEDGPGSRWGHKMVYDQEREVFVMFGGVRNSLILGDTWEFDGETWTEVTPANEDDSPSPRRDHVMVYDSRLKKTLLFGGRDASPDGSNDLWAWDGEKWTEIDAENAPSIRHESMGVFDTWRNKLVIFGGSSGFLEDDRYKDDTWTWPHSLPEIVHTPDQKGIDPNTDLIITAEVNKIKSDDFEVRLFYRNPEKKNYKSTRMEELNNGDWQATIEMDEIENPGVEYYIGVIDRGDTDEWNYWGNDLNPQFVSRGTTGRLKVIISPKAARDADARWRIKGTETWYASGKVVDKLEPGEYTVEFQNIEGFIESAEIDFEIINGRKTEIVAIFTERSS